MFLLPPCYRYIAFLLIFESFCCSASLSRQGKSPRDCLRGSETKANRILALFDSLVTTGPSYALLSNLTKAFETRNDRAEHNIDLAECEKKAFLSIDDKFNSLESTIKSLHAQSDLKSSRIEARQTINKVRAVFIALDLYDQQKEDSSRLDAINQCTLNHPRNSLIALHSQVTSTPNLFEEMLEGTRYSLTDFDKMSSAWIKQAGFCVLLMQACDKLKDTIASTTLQNVRMKQATNMLLDIHQMLLEAQQKLKEDFKVVVVDDILAMLKEIAILEKTRTQGVEIIHQQLSNKFPFREWAVMMYDRVDSGDTSVHAHEGSTDNWFMVNDDHHTVIAHSADNSLNCTFFEDKFRDNKSLKDYFDTPVFGKCPIAQWTKVEIIVAHDYYFLEYANYANFVRSDYHGHLGNAISILKQIFQKQQLPQTFFFSVIGHQPSLAVKRGRQFHHFEHVRLSDSQPATKSVLIGWC